MDLTNVNGGGVKFVISKISIIFAYAEVKKDTAF